MIKAVVFDLDNTLIDFMSMKSQAVNAAVYAMIDAGLRLSPEEVKARIDAIYKEKGIEYQNVFDQLMSELYNKPNYKVLSSGIIAYRRAREAAMVPYPHVFMVLTELIKRGLKIGVVSDAPAREAWLRLCQLNLHHLFDAVVTFDDTGERKPSPVPFMKILAALGTQASEAIMVGDWAERDMVGASKVGMKTAFARYGDTFGTIHTNADFELKDIEELLPIVDAQNGKAKV